MVFFRWKLHKNWNSFLTKKNFFKYSSNKSSEAQKKYKYSFKKALLTPLPIILFIKKSTSDTPACHIVQAPMLAEKLRGAAQTTRELGDATSLRILPEVARGHVALIGRHRRILAFVPIGILGAGIKVFGVGERRHPAAVTQHRVPADMVGMQMRTEHHVDVFRRGAGGSQAIKVRRILLMEAMRPWPILVIAAAGIEQNGQTIQANEP